MLKSLDFSKKWLRVALFVLVFLSLSLCYKYPAWLEKRPYSTHQWRQCDGLSVTLNYAKESLNFFEPRMHWQGSVEGKAIAEFPILYYINGIIWRFAGQSEMLYRLMVVLTVFVCLFYLFEMLFCLFKNVFWSISICVLAFTSPVFVYYSNNFLPNIVAVSLVFVGWHLFYRYTVERRLNLLIYALSWFTLSTLIRSTAAIAFGPLYLLVGLFVFNRLPRDEVFHHKKWKIVLLHVFPIIIVGAWFLFVKQYNAEHHDAYFLTQTRPFWTISYSEILSLGRTFFNIQLPVLYSRPTQLVLFLMFVVVLLGRLPSWVKWVYSFSVLCALAYFLLWYNNFYAHDYYMLDFHPILVATVALCVYSLLMTEGDTGVLAKVIVVIFLLVNVYYCTVKTRERFGMNDGFVVNTVILPKEEMEGHAYSHWNYSVKYEAFERVQPYLREIGIKRTDIVVSYPDISPNVTLYLMDQKGYTTLYTDGQTNFNDEISRWKSSGAKYLIINDTSFVREKHIETYTTNKIGQFENIFIYRL